jgi:hypothetical protein
MYHTPKLPKSKLLELLLLSDNLNQVSPLKNIHPKPFPGASNSLAKKKKKNIQINQKSLKKKYYLILIYFSIV